MSNAPAPVTRGETAYRLRQAERPWKDVATEMGYPRADNAIQIAKKWCRNENKRRERDGAEPLPWPPTSSNGRAAIGEGCYKAKRWDPSRTWREIGVEFGVPATTANKAAAEYARTENAKRERKGKDPLPWPLVSNRASGRRAFEMRQRHPDWSWQKISRCMGYPETSKHSAWDAAKSYFARENDRRGQAGEALLTWPPETNTT